MDTSSRLQNVGLGYSLVTGSEVDIKCIRNWIYGIFYYDFRIYTVFLFSVVCVMRTRFRFCVLVDYLCFLCFGYHRLFVSIH